MCSNLYTEINIEGSETNTTAVCKRKNLPYLFAYKPSYLAQNYHKKK